MRHSRNQSNLKEALGHYFSVQFFSFSNALTRHLYLQCRRYFGRSKWMRYTRYKLILRNNIPNTKRKIVNSLNLKYSSLDFQSLITSIKYAIIMAIRGPKAKATNMQKAAENTSMRRCIETFHEVHRIAILAAFLVANYETKSKNTGKVRLNGDSDWQTNMQLLSLVNTEAIATNCLANETLTFNGKKVVIRTKLTAIRFGFDFIFVHKLWYHLSSSAIVKTNSFKC